MALDVALSCPRPSRSVTCSRLHFLHCTMLSVATVPEEILLHIFQFYITMGSPCHLVTVCRKFHRVVISAPLLWNDIVFYDFLSKYSYHCDWTGGRRLPVDNFGNKIYCRSIEALGQAINRTRRTKFNFTVILRHDSAYPPHEWTQIKTLVSWSGQCRALNLVYLGSTQILPYMQDLSGLESLEIAINPSDRISPVVSLLRTVQDTNKCLHHLYISTRFEPLNGLIGPFEDLKPLFSRLTSLHLPCMSFDDLRGIVAVAKQVKILGFDTPIAPTMIETTLECPSQSLRELAMTLSCRLISTTIFGMLERLTIRTVSIRQQDAAAVNLPELRYLNVTGWWQIIAKFEAPKLYSLELHGRSDFNGIELEHLGSMTMRPPKVDINMVIKEIEMQRLIGQIGDGVTDMQIVYIGENKSLYSTLASAFRGTAKKKQLLCPNLRRLVVISHEREASRRQQSEQMLKRIVDERRKTVPLEEAIYGWYKLVTYADEPRRAPTEWVDILNS